MTKVLKLALLGPVSVQQGDSPLADLAAAKAHALLYYLAVTGRPHSRQALAGLLWGDLPEADARRNLRGVVMKLRQVVDAHLLVTYQDLALDSRSDYQLDVAEFRQLLTMPQGQQPTLAQLRAAIALYRGDFLEDFYVRQAPAFEEWVVQQQTQLREMVLQAYHTAILLCREQELLDVGVAYARELLQMDPVREEAHRQLMWLLARQGQRSAALAQYEICRDVLAQELNLEPATETAVLYEHIRQGDISRQESERLLVPAPQPPMISHEATPFVVGPPIVQPAQFFGRERELKRLFNLLKRLPLQNAAIIGPRRSGKTSLLHYLRTITTTAPDHLRSRQQSEWLSGPERYRWVFVDFQDPRLSSREALLLHLLTHMGLPVPAACDLDQFLDIVTDQLHHPTVILFDEIGVALERYQELDDMFWESLRSLATNQVEGNLAFILAAPEAPDELAHYQGLGSPFFNIFGYTARLGPLTDNEARDLIASSPIPFSSSDVHWILEQSACWPILVQSLCRERLFTLEEGDQSDAWRADALQQIASFLELKTYVT